MNVDGCLGYLRELTVECPDFADAWNNLGLVLGHLGDHAEAIKAFDKALEINPQYTEAAISRCFSLADAGDPTKAFREFRRRRIGNYDDFNVVFPFAIFCMRHGWNETGVTQLLRAEGLRPTVPYLLANTAEALLQVGDLKGAAEHRNRLHRAILDLQIDRLVSRVLARNDWALYRRWQNPFYAKIPILNAQFLTSEGHPQGAEAELLSGNCNYPGHSRLMLEMGRSLLSQQRLDEARQWLSTAILIHQSPQAFFELGFLHAQSENVSKAEQALRTAVNLRPLYPDFRFHFGTLLMEMGQVGPAITQFKRCLAINPDDGHCMLQLANAYMSQYEPGKALEVLSSTTCRNWPEAMVLSAQAHLRAGQNEDAKNLLRKALEIDDANTEAIEALELLGTG